MKAVVHDRFGPPEVLRIEDVPAPVPADDELLVRVRATTVNQTDCHVRRAEPIPWRFRIGVFRPKWTTLGMEFAGEVEAVGSAVAEFGVGDRVFGMKNHGANAELVTVRESRLVAHLPDALSFEEGAAVIDGAYQGLSALRRGASVRARACSCTARRARAERRACSSDAISVRTSRRCAGRRTSSSCARSAPTSSSTTSARTSGSPARSTT